MAIKISGTTVIDDDRNIQNVGIITAVTSEASDFIDDGINLLTEINTKVSTGKAISFSLLFGY